MDRSSDRWRCRRQWPLGNFHLLITIVTVVLIIIQVQCATVPAGVLSENSMSNKTDSSSMVVVEVVTNTTSSDEMATTTEEVLLTTNNEVERENNNKKKVDKDRSHIFKNLRDDLQMPENCRNFERQPDQPQITSTATWKKCCPEGFILTKNRTCEKGEGIVTKFIPPFINATFFKDCIEDSEVINFDLEPMIYLLDNHSLFYGENYGDHLYILQNGSLLTVSENMLSGYDIYKDYCLDIDPLAHGFFALVWGADIPTEMVSQIVISKFFKGIAFIMIISFCCLTVTFTLYLIIPRFGTLHGRSFAVHAINLALGYVFTAAMYFQYDGHSKSEGNGYLQYFISAAFVWQFTMCVDTVINVWYYIPKKISPIEGRYRGWIHFACYVLFSQCLPFLFIIHHSGEADSAAAINYYMSTMDEENHDDQWRFFGPILAIIILCVIMFGAIYYGFRKLNEIQSFAYIIRMKLRKQRKEEIVMPFCSKEMEYVKNAARATCILFIIQSLCFISEVITFYTTNDSSIFFELINALQGVFILVLFVLMPKQLVIIRQWWAGDRGSLVVEQTPQRRPVRREEEPLNNNEDGLVEKA